VVCLRIKREVEKGSEVVTNSSGADSERNYLRWNTGGTERESERTVTNQQGRRKPNQTEGRILSIYLLFFSITVHIQLSFL